MGVRKRITTGRLMMAVALCSIPMAGLTDRVQPGIHLPVGGGLRAGVCRDDGFGGARDDHGAVAGSPYQLGVWERGGSGRMRLGLRLRAGVLTGWAGGAGVVLL